MYIDRDYTAKEIYDNGVGSLITIVKGEEFKIVVDDYKGSPVLYIDNSYNDTFNIDEKKEFRKLSTCIKHIEKELYKIYKKLNNFYKNEEKETSKYFNERPGLMQFTYKPSEKIVLETLTKTPYNIKYIENPSFEMIKIVLSNSIVYLPFIKEKKLKILNDKELLELNVLINKEKNDFQMEVVKSKTPKDILRDLIKLRIKIPINKDSF